MEKELESNLRIVFNFDSYASPVQKQAVEAVNLGLQDVFISMPTGAGKSLCYHLPAISKTRSGVTVIITPLIALMQNQLEGLHKLGICAKTINSTMTISDRESVTNELQSDHPEIKLLYVTPEQLATNGFRHILSVMHKNKQLARFAVDEAHCVSEWGHDFRHDYLRLGEVRRMYLDIPWVALTATASVKVMQDVIKQLSLKQPIATFKTSSFRPNLFYDVVFKDCLDDVYEDLKSFSVKALGDGWELESEKIRGCGIIYCRRREDCDDISFKLSGMGLKCIPYHAGLKPRERTENQIQWTEGKIPVIAATISFGMGIDKATVRFVVHWSVSQSIPGYYQESGRAGRDKKPSLCRIYYSRKDQNAINFLLQRDKTTAKNERRKKHSEIAMKSFESMVKYCENTLCRHSIFAREFGDQLEKCKKHCDICTNPKSAERKLAAFKARCVSRSLTGTYMKASCDSDYNDLYGEGRRGIKREGEDYWNGGSDSSGDERTERKERSKFIRDELRKRAKSSRPEEKKFIGPTDVLQPKTTFIPEVTHSMRAEYLGKLEQEMNTHYDHCKLFFNTSLTSLDIKKCAAEKELSIIRDKRNIHMYRKEFVDTLKSLKDYSKRLEIHPLLSSYVPVNVVYEKNDIRSFFGLKGENDCKGEKLTSTCSAIPEQHLKKELDSSSDCDYLVKTSPESVETRENTVSVGETKFLLKNSCSLQASPEAAELKENTVLPEDSDLPLIISSSPKSSPQFEDLKQEQKDEVDLKSRTAIQYFFESKSDTSKVEATLEPTVKSERKKHKSSKKEISPKNPSKLNSTAHSKKTKDKTKLLPTELESKSSSVSHKENSPKNPSNLNSTTQSKKNKDKTKPLESKSSSISYKDTTSKSHSALVDGSLKSAADFVKRCLDPMYKKKRLDKDAYRIVCKKLSHQLVDTKQVSKEGAESAVKCLFKKYKVLTPEIVSQL